MQLPRTFNLSEHLLGRRVEEGNADRRALLTDDGAWSYGEVLTLASRYGNLLRDAGVRPEERVLIALPDGPDFVGALFGTIRAGSVAVMLNPHLTVDQIRHQLEYTAAAALLVHADLAGPFREAAETAIHRPLMVEVGSPSFQAALDAAPDELDPHPSHPDDAALWLYSGGTTGHPKGVVQSHRSFANTTELYGGGVLAMAPDDVTLSVPKLYFGYATGSNLFFPFAAGATATLFPERCTAETLFAKIEAFRPTVLVNVPTMVAKLLDHPGAAARDLSSLRVATSAGEALPVELHERWVETFGVPLLDGLGTAEMWHIFVSNRIDAMRPGTLGKAVPGFDVRACDENGVNVPPGEVGHLWVGGDSRATGYWRSSEKDREAFRGRWYVSGDMISIDRDGWVTYCGRADDMLKVGGKWLSPRELEDCLLAHPAVREVAVVGVATDGLVKPHAFVVAEPERETDKDFVNELQAWARARLEPYKYPRKVVFLDDLPRTHLGKVDRGRLARGGAATSESPDGPG